ncbi:MAG: AAA family ATPase [Acidimicrobiia bacterium]|nr:AAA family ATPase [Acidimicrobiia bacterium]
MDNTNDLAVLLASQYPLLLVEAQEEQRLLDIIRQAADRLDLPVWTWSATRGLAKDGHHTQYQTIDPHVALEFVGELSGPGVFVFTDVHPHLSDSLVVRRIKEIAQTGRRGQTLVLTGPRNEVPPEIESLAHQWSLKPPDRDELSALVKRTLDTFAARSFPVVVNGAEVEQMVDALLGLTIPEAERLVQREALRDGQISPADIPALRNAKAELLNSDGILELVAADVGTLETIGGLNGLKSWLRLRRRVMISDDALPGLDPPRGVLLTGVPGCGKSLVAKTLAQTWGLPLVLLDPSRLYSKYIGESEQRLIAALSTVEAMAPAVLWIDEIEKGLASSGDGDGGVSRRLLGTFLRWMQERRGDVFMVATANDVSALPPELLRRGRFDEIFFVDLPDPGERAEIISIHLIKRGQDPSGFDLAPLVAASDGFSGAELETVVVGALYRALADEDDLTTANLMMELAATVPLSVSRREDVASLRAWADGRAVFA